MTLNRKAAALSTQPLPENQAANKMTSLPPGPKTRDISFKVVGRKIYSLGKVDTTVSKVETGNGRFSARPVHMNS